MTQIQQKRSEISKAPMLLLAAAVLSLGLVLIFSQPLPERVEFSGILVGDQYFAPEIGALAPPFSLPSLSDGEMVDLLSLRGAPIVINFWATWCPPCEAEMPELAQFSRDHPSVRLLSINVGESPAQVNDWLKDRNLELEVLMDLNSDVSAAYRLRGQPTSFVLNSDGVVVWTIYGPTTLNQLQIIIEPLL